VLSAARSVVYCAIVRAVALGGCIGPSRLFCPGIHSLAWTRLPIEHRRAWRWMQCLVLIKKPPAEGDLPGLQGKEKVTKLEQNRLG